MKKKNEKYMFDGRSKFNVFLVDDYFDVDSLVNWGPSVFFFPCVDIDVATKIKSK